MQYSYYAVQESRRLNILGAVGWKIVGSFFFTIIVTLRIEDG